MRKCRLNICKIGAPVFSKPDARSLKNAVIEQGLPRATKNGCLDCDVEAIQFQKRDEAIGYSV